GAAGGAGQDEQGAAASSSGGEPTHGHQHAPIHSASGCAVPVLRPRGAQLLLRLECSHHAQAACAGGLAERTPIPLLPHTGRGGCSSDVHGESRAAGRPSCAAIRCSTILYRSATLHHRSAIRPSTSSYASIKSTRPPGKPLSFPAFSSLSKRIRFLPPLPPPASPSSCLLSPMPAFFLPCLLSSSIACFLPPMPAFFLPCLLSSSHACCLPFPSPPLLLCVRRAPPFLPSASFHFFLPSSSLPLCTIT
ncbi:unnamed protein product, partial [Closterium sp. NIES-54]